MWDASLVMCVLMWGHLGEARSPPQLPPPATVVVAGEDHHNSASAEGVGGQQANPLLLLPGSPYNYDYHYGHPDYHYDTPDGRPAVEDPPQTWETVEVEQRQSGRVEEEEEEERESERLEEDSEEVEEEPEELEEDEGEDLRGNLEEEVEEVKTHSTSSRIFSWLESTWSQMVDGVEGLVAGVEEVRKGLVELVERMGEEVERGAEYVRNRLQETANYVDSKSRDVLRVLEEAVKRGDERVVDLFRLIGKKVDHWTEQVQARVQEATEEQGSALGRWFSYWSRWHSEQEQQDSMPDLFEDEEVREKLEDLVQGGVLNRADLAGVGML